MKKLVLTLCVLGALVSCSKDDNGPGFVPQPTGRTVIVYMSGENNLSTKVDLNLSEMKEGSKKLGKDDCLLVYVDKFKSKEKNELPWMARIQNGQVTDSVSLRDMGISDKDEFASDPQIMEDVLKYAVRRYPATQDYGLVLWGHCTGWLINNDSIAYTRAFGVDNGNNQVFSVNPKWMNIPTLARVLKKLPHMKFIFADCCMFMCLESLYELRSVADYIIGSPAEIPDYGAPYNTVVPALFDRENFATKIVEEYYAQKNGPNKNLDLPLTVVNMSEMDPLAKATRTVLQAIKGQQTTDYADLTNLIYYFYNSHNLSYNPFNNIFYDAGDFICAKAPAADYKVWKEALDKAIVKKKYSAHWYTVVEKYWDNLYGNNFTVTEERQSGVSMYIPQAQKKDNEETPYIKYQANIKKFAWYYAVWE